MVMPCARVPRIPSSPPTARAKFPEEAEIKHWYSGCIHPEPLFDFCEPLVTLPQALFQNAIAFSIVPLAGYLAYWSIKASPKQFTDREPMLPEDVAKARKAVGVHNEHA